MRRALAYVTIVGAAAGVAALARLEPRQVLATTIFVGFIAGTLLYWKFRLGFALAGVAVLLAAGVLDLPHLIEFAGLDVILFLVGMIVVIGFLEERRFFEVVVEAVLRAVGRGPWALMATLMSLAALSAALVDEVTSILFIAAVTLHVTRRFGMNPAPFIIMAVFATNIGSSATVVGNPIGVMIALRAGLTFPDFLRWATPIALAALLLAIPLSFLYFRRNLAALGRGMAEARGAAVEVEPIRRRDLIISAGLFVGTIAGLILHARIETALGLGKNAMLVGVALLAAGVCLFLEGDRARELVERRVDWWTLAFFLLLFASAGTLRYVGVTGRIAQGILGLTGGSPTALLLTVTWASGILSAFMDNVLAVATFIPIVHDLAQAGAAVAPLWWGLLFGGTLLGNLTLIGSTANIVALGILERQEKIHVGFVQWLRPGLVVSLPTLALATLLLWLQMGWMR